MNASANSDAPQLSPEEVNNKTDCTITVYDPDTTLPERMVGVRISVEWAGSKWFPGVITEYNGISQKHCILYDDKDVRSPPPMMKIRIVYAC
jgi:hypothetical protein